MESDAHNSSSLSLLVHAMGIAVGDETPCDQWQNLSPPAHSALVLVCRAKRTSVRLPVQRMPEHPPFLKIGRAERGLKIDPPLITVSLKYL